MKCYKMHSERAALRERKIIAAVGEFAYFRQADRRREKLRSLTPPAISCNLLLQ